MSRLRNDLPLRGRHRRPAAERRVGGDSLRPLQLQGVRADDQVLRLRAGRCAADNGGIAVTDEQKEQAFEQAFCEASNHAYDTVLTAGPTIWEKTIARRVYYLAFEA